MPAPLTPDQLKKLQEARKARKKPVPDPYPKTRNINQLTNQTILKHASGRKLARMKSAKIQIIKAEKKRLKEEELLRIAKLEERVPNEINWDKVNQYL